MSWDVYRDLDTLIGLCDSIVNFQSHILNHLDKQEREMADITTDLADLKDTVGGIATDVAAVLNQLKQQPNITTDQISSLEQQIQALHDVKASLDAAQQQSTGGTGAPTNPPTTAP